MEITECGAVALSGRLARREVSAAEVMAAVLDRIERVNPALNAIVSLRDRDALMAEARVADASPRKGWLHGIPVAVKDLAETAGIATTMGSPILAGNVPKADCGMVARMKAAGAIVIGKTNVPEFGLGSHTTNPVFGPTRNPYAPGRTPGGSSGGAAAALAARLLPVADGSDMMGSLRNPAGWCNVYGFRPTWGRVPADPVEDTYLHRLATDGPMGRSPEDILALLGTLAAADPRWPGPGWPPLQGPLDADVRGRRIAWAADWGGAYPMEAGLLPLCESALATFGTLGVAVEPIAPPHPAEALWDSWTALRSFSVATRLGPLWSDPAKRARLNAQALFEIDRGRALSALDLQRASALRSAWLRSAVALFARFDALVLPAAQLFPFDLSLAWPAEIAGRAMDSYHRWMEVVVPASLLGLPALAVPAGFDARGLPMGLQIIGAPGRDMEVLQLGQAWHRATGWPEGRPPPAPA
jgi:amidase